MATDHSFFDDFFAPAYNAQTQEYKCLHCLKSSKDATGHSVASGTLWVCDDCYPEYVAAEAERVAVVSDNRDDRDIFEGYYGNDRGE